jgi:hypothetical protein
MKRAGWTRGRVSLRARAWVLWLALLPMLTFAGHWTLRIDIPGTDLYLGLPVVSGADHHDETDTGHADGHEQHCHASAASCSDVPFAGASAFALLSETAALLGAGGLFTAINAGWWRPGSPAVVTPDLQPPRTLPA